MRGWRLLACLPPLVLALAVAAWGVDVPYWDQWELVPHLEAVARGDWPFEALWRQHNEHRAFLPKLAMLALAQATGWNVRAEMALDVVLALGIFAAVVLTLAQTRSSEPPPGWIVPLMALLVFNPNQWESWGWGWQMTAFLSALAVTAGIALLARDADRPRRFVPAALCGLTASFSFACGLLFWVVALPLVALPPRQRAPRVGAWMVIAGLVLAGYLHRLELPPGGQVDWTAPRTLPLFAAYVAVYLGAPLCAFAERLALCAGIGGVVAATALGLSAFRRLSAPRSDPGGEGGRLLPWLSLAGWAVASAAMTAAGRLHHGLDQALASRYVTFSSLFWIALLGAWAVVRRGVVPERRRWERLAAAGLAAALLLNGTRGALYFRSQHAERERGRAAVLRGGPSEDLAKLYPRPETILERRQALERLDLSLYRRPADGRR